MTSVCFYCGETSSSQPPCSCEACGAFLTLSLDEGTPMESLDAAARLNGYPLGMHYTGIEALESLYLNLGFTVRSLVFGEDLERPGALA